jgi:hypothetical protein
MKKNATEVLMWVNGADLNTKRRSIIIPVDILKFGCSGVIGDIALCGYFLT